MLHNSYVGSKIHNYKIKQAKEMGGGMKCNGTLLDEVGWDNQNITSS